MKGKYITTSLILAILGNGRTAKSIITAETPANTKDHELIWTKDMATAQPDDERDELKFA